MPVISLSEMLMLNDGEGFHVSELGFMLLRVKNERKGGIVVSLPAE